VPVPAVECCSRSHLSGPALHNDKDATAPAGGHEGARNRKSLDRVREVGAREEPAEVSGTRPVLPRVPRGASLGLQPVSLGEAVTAFAATEAVVCPDTVAVSPDTFSGAIVVVVVVVVVVVMLVQPLIVSCEFPVSPVADADVIVAPRGASTKN